MMDEGERWITVNKGAADERRHFFGTSNSYSHMLAVSLSYAF